MTNAMLHQSEPDDYQSLLRATRPALAVSLALIAFVLSSMVFGRSHREIEGWSLGSQIFDATLLIASVVLGWPTRKAWITTIWENQSVWTVCAYALGSVVLVAAAAVGQGLLTPDGATVLHPEKPPIVMFALLGPLAETLIFQGWIQTAIGRVAGPIAAFAITSILFWAIHLQINAALIVAVLALSYIRMRTRSLGAVALTHAAINTMMFFLI